MKHGRGAPARRAAYAGPWTLTRFNRPVFGTSFRPVGVDVLPPPRGHDPGPGTQPDALGPFDTW